jgi:hypothetical protein
LRLELALPPDSSETFLKEVDENLRREQFQSFFKTYGAWVAGAVVLFLAAVGGWIYWEQHQKKESAGESEELHAVFADIADQQMKTVPQRLDKLADSDNDIVKASAILAEAAVALDKNDRAAAISKYREISGDKGLPQPYRDLAMVRVTALEFDAIAPEQVISRLEPLAKAGNPWFGSAGELTALAYLKHGKKTEAGRMFAAIAADRQVPGTIRSRAVQIAGTLGVDASASLPALEGQD